MQYKISCLIFDFDGVIANTDLARFKILKQLLKNYDLKLSNSLNQKDLIGLSTQGFLKKHSAFLSNKVVEKIVKKRHEIFFSNLKDYCIPYDSMIDTIKYFYSKFDLAIATTNDLENVMIQLEYLNIIDYFKWIFGRDITEGTNLEKTYHLVPKVIDKKISECIVIEDSDFGVNAAVRDGFYCIRFDPDKIFLKGLENDKVHNYNELKEKIDESTIR